MFDSAHVLVRPGMSRQLLAAGARLHRDRLSVLAPAADDAEMDQVLERVAARDATPESVLDHGFDPSLAAREAMRRQPVEAVREPGAIATALGRLQRFAGLADQPTDIVPKGVGGDVMAELIGATLVRTGEAPGAEDRLALEAHVTTLSDPRG